MHVRKRWSIWPIATMLLLASGSRSLHGQQNHNSQVLKLPDPTPRDIPPELKFHNDPPAPTASQKLLTAQNEKRWQLIVWATDELVVLSERADKAAGDASGDASKKELADNVAKIETVAKSLTAALKAH